MFCCLSAPAHLSTERQRDRPARGRRTCLSSHPLITTLSPATPQHEAAFEDISSAKNTDEMLRVVLRGSDIWMVSLQTLGKNDSSDISGCGTQLVACAERSRGLLRRAAAMPMQQLLGNPRLGVRLVLQLGSAAKALTKPAAKMEIGELLSRAREFEQLVEAACAAFDSCSRQARSGVGSGWRCAWLQTVGLAAYPAMVGADAYAACRRVVAWQVLLRNEALPAGSQLAMPPPTIRPRS